VLRLGASPRRLIAGFMLASALLSMWVSNTATAIMMLPIGVSVLGLLESQEDEAASAYSPEERQALSAALVLGIAYACSIGGIGTLIGTPPNLVLAAFLQEHYGIQLSMAGWMVIGLPLVAVLLPLAWLYLTRAAFQVPVRPLPCGREVLQRELEALGSLSRAERRVGTVFLLTAAAWILRPQLAAWFGLGGLSDTVIAITTGLLLFVLPSGERRGERLLDWDSAVQVPWGILILFGGGLSLAAAIAANGVDAFIGAGFAGLAGAPLLVILLVVTAGVILLTEITSNTAVTTTLMPVLAAAALALGAPPGMLLTAAAVAASCAFMLPVATPPNAVVFSSGKVSIAQMARAGIWLNLVALLVITLVVGLGARHALIE
jgi:sodium-dependent dicarboxylate transporter 2/3/5